MGKGSRCPPGVEENDCLYLQFIPLEGLMSAFGFLEDSH